MEPCVHSGCVRLNGANALGHKHPLNTFRTYLCHDGAPSKGLDDRATECVFDT